MKTAPRQLRPRDAATAAAADAAAMAAAAAVVVDATTITTNTTTRETTMILERRRRNRRRRHLARYFHSYHRRLRRRRRYYRHLGRSCYCHCCRSEKRQIDTRKEERASKIVEEKRNHKDLTREKNDAPPVAIGCYTG